MEELLPREILWADKKTMKEFLQEPLNQKIYEVYLNIKRDGAIKDYDTLKLFNEVYYQCSRIVNCTRQTISLNDIISDIKKNLGWYFSTSLVVNMIYAVLALRHDNTPSAVHLINRIKDHYRLETYVTPFSKMVKECVERNEWYTIEFPIKTNTIHASSLLFGKNMKDISHLVGKNPIILIDKVDQLNAILGNNATINK